MKRGEVIAGSLAVLCGENGARGIVCSLTDHDVTLIATHGAVDQTFLDEAGRRWMNDPPASDLVVLDVKGGVVVLDRLSEQASPKVRDYLLLAIGQALLETRGSSPPESPEEERRQQLLRRLKRAGWNVSEAARQEGITRRALYYRMQAFGIRRERPT